MIVISGFEPFGRHAVNSSEALVRAAERSSRLTGLIARSVILPVEFDRCYAILHDILESTPHRAVVCFGQTTYSEARLEHVARNRDHVRDGEPPRHRERVIRAEAPPELSSTLPLEDIATGLTTAGIPFAHSDDAGGYVCNNLFFHLMAAPRRSSVPCGFIHMPRLGPEGWPEERIAAAGDAVIETVATFLSQDA